MQHRLCRPSILLAALALLTSCPPAFAQSTGHTVTQPPARLADQPQEFILVGAGDIASCKNLAGARATARLLEEIPGTVFALGDLAYEKGTTADFQNCYDPTWGRVKSRTRPALGNHEYGLRGPASGYFQYWGGQAGPAGKGYYSYDLGSWHIVVLNTNCDSPGVGGCYAGSPQETWLKADLAAHPKACVIGYGHHPLFSSGIFHDHAIHLELKPLWQDLYAARADVVLVGHEHSYERFVPQDPDGHADERNGIREIVVGTGGRSHEFLGFAQPNSEVRDWTSFGVLKLTLTPGHYAWEFIPVPHATFHDSGEADCHNRSVSQ
jgi:calcineurin-like phosphoesterase family protein